MKYSYIKDIICFKGKPILFKGKNPTKSQIKLTSRLFLHARDLYVFDEKTESFEKILDGVFHTVEAFELKSGTLLLTKEYQTRLKKAYFYSNSLVDLGFDIYKVKISRTPSDYIITEQGVYLIKNEKTVPVVGTTIRTDSFIDGNFENNIIILNRKMYILKENRIEEIEGLNVDSFLRKPELIVREEFGNTSVYRDGDDSCYYIIGNRGYRGNQETYAISKNGKVTIYSKSDNKPLHSHRTDEDFIYVESDGIYRVDKRLISKDGKYISKRGYSHIEEFVSGKNKYYVGYGYNGEMGSKSITIHTADIKQVVEFKYNGNFLNTESYTKFHQITYGMVQTLETKNKLDYFFITEVIFEQGKVCILKTNPPQVFDITEDNYWVFFPNIIKYFMFSEQTLNKFIFLKFFDF